MPADDRVVFGATVDLEDQDDGVAMRYQIVGELEADARLGLISITSPIARALVGKREGDVVEVAVPGGVKRLRDRQGELRLGVGNLAQSLFVKMTQCQPGSSIPGFSGLAR